LHVGHSYTGTMALENGAAVTVQSFALHHTETITDVGEAWSRVTLDQEGPGANPSSLTVLDSAVIGWRNIGQLGILNGASANVGDDLFLSGVGGFGEIYLHDASSLLVNGDLITAWEGNSAAKLAATSDSQVQILGNLEASSGAGSSLFYVTEPGTRLEVDGICYLGAGELSTVQMRIAAGGVFDCGQATYVGYQNQAYTAWVTVGAGNGGPGRLQGMRLWVGQDTLGGAPADLLIGAVGLEGGEIEMAVSVYVDAHGAITGTGTIAPGFGIVVANGGYLAPGLDPDQPPARLARQTAAEGAPGTLTIAGALTLSDTARLALDLFGPTAAEQDRLVVSDTAVFNGILALNFTNGYAPRQGDVLTFVTVSGAASGSFADVTISGLEPGFAFDVDVSGGAVTLTALNDGVPTTGGQYRLYLPLARQP
ncbi:MAG: autotransporter outer membrane beta-barrel domain-containing protein, partial [Anaerolineales bacterium]|nr:autotransporter outer membrane beta-barrel domain-containing protein [Anaerolineales bacterium]